MRHAVSLCRRKLERIALIVVIGAQIDAVALGPALGHAHDADEETRALVERRRQQFDVPEMSDAIHGFGLHGPRSSAFDGGSIVADGSRECQDQIIGRHRLYSGKRQTGLFGGRTQVAHIAHTPVRVLRP